MGDMKAIRLPINCTLEQLREAVALSLPFPESRYFLDDSAGKTFIATKDLARNYGISCVPCVLAQVATETISAALCVAITVAVFMGVF